MSVTVMYFTPEPLIKMDESFGMDVLHHIPFCRGKTFSGDSRYTFVLGFPTACMAVFINDVEHHSDDLYVLFSLPGGSFFFQNEFGRCYKHEITQCVQLLEGAFETEFSDVTYCSNGDVAVVFKGAGPIIRQRVLSDHRKYLMSAVG
jgi:hypothetical protein